MQRWLPETLSFRSESKCLKHLAPFTHRLAGHGPAGIDLVIRVAFESHVFSKSGGDGPHDFLDESGNKRFFCPDRYAFSQNLGVEVRKVLDQNVYTWEVKDRNGVANLAVLAPATVELISGSHNVLIYYLYKSSVPGLHVEMIVKSSYLKQISFGRHLRREKIRVCIKNVCFNGGRIPKA